MRLWLRPVIVNELLSKGAGCSGRLFSSCVTHAVTRGWTLAGPTSTVRNCFLFGQMWALLTSGLGHGAAMVSRDLCSNCFYIFFYFPCQIDLVWRPDWALFDFSSKAGNSGSSGNVFLLHFLVKLLVKWPHFFQAEQNPQPPASGSSGKLDQVQSQVNEVKDILKDNIDKVLERGDRLNDLIDKTDDLQASVSGTRACRWILTHLNSKARLFWLKSIQKMPK